MDNGYTKELTIGNRCYRTRVTSAVGLGAKTSRTSMKDWEAKNLRPVSVRITVIRIAVMWTLF